MFRLCQFYYKLDYFFLCHSRLRLLKMLQTMTNHFLLLRQNNGKRHNFDLIRTVTALAKKVLDILVNFFKELMYVGINRKNSCSYLVDRSTPSNNLLQKMLSKGTFLARLVNEKRIRLAKHSAYLAFVAFFLSAIIKILPTKWLCRTGCIKKLK